MAYQGLMYFRISHIHLSEISIHLLVVLRDESRLFFDTGVYLHWSTACATSLWTTFLILSGGGYSIVL